MSHMQFHVSLRCATLSGKRPLCLLARKCDMGGEQDTACGMTIPNLITIMRLILVPLIIVMLTQGRWMAALTLFVIAGVSDAIDGFIAKRFNMSSELGAYLDPIADKALLVSIYVTLAVIGVLPVWIVVLVVSRDVMIVSAILLSWVMEKPVDINPLLVSKLNTTAQIGFAAVVLTAKAFDIALGGGELVGLVIVAALTLASMAAYLALWLKHMAASI
jgi:cardiolipin synthase (CMP-forming)